MKSSNRNFDARVSGNHLIVVAAHPVAKQLFWGWGSDHNADDMSFYGREDPSDTWRGNPDYRRWMWTLSADAVDLMINNIENHIGDTNYYARGEVKKARELLALLKKMEKKL